MANVETDSVDRGKKCPFLIRVFFSNSGHNNLSEYNRGRTPNNELQISTWMDATLKEITALIQEARPDYRNKGTVMDYAVVSSINNPRGNRMGMNGAFYHYNMKDVGSVTTGRGSPSDSKTLSKCEFEIGDYMDVAVSMPGSRFDRRRNDRGGPRRRGGFGGDGGGRRPRPY